MKKFYFIILVLQGILTVNGNDEDQNPFDIIWKLNQQHKETFSTRVKDPELFEGDIIMTHDLNRTIENMKYAAKTGNSPFDAIRGGQWTNGVVPYAFASGFSRYGRKRVREAIAHYKQRVPCITWRPKRRGDRSYATFYHGGGCSSHIGRQRRPQKISLAAGCLRSLGVIVHEMMHCLGFYHEQSRLDRDRYIRVYFGNINGRMKYNFQKYRAGQASTLGEPYDKRSVMHYGNFAFSINRRKTIVSKSNPNEVLGQRRGLSRIDIRQLKKYYKCGRTTRPKPRPRPRPSRCKDGYPFCTVFPRSSNSRWCAHPWVSRNCRKSCRRCAQPRRKKTCRDKDKRCRAWSRGGFCTKPANRSWMKDNCKGSCTMHCP